MKFVILLVIIVISPIIGGIYGILHDQFTYSISTEYYTRFKFEQFGLAETNMGEYLPAPRLNAAIIGWKATWWMGIPIGIILALVNLGQPTAKKMWQVSLKALLVTMAVAFITGLIGLLYGFIHTIHQPIKELSNWYIPENLIQRDRFIIVGSIHNFSYLGGVLGLIIAIIYSILTRFRMAGSATT